MQIIDKRENVKKAFKKQDIQFLKQRKQNMNFKILNASIKINKVLLKIQKS